MTDAEEWLRDVADVRLLLTVDGTPPLSVSFDDAIEAFRSAMARDTFTSVMSVHGPVLFTNPLHARIEVDEESVPQGVDLETAQRRVIDAANAVAAALRADLDSR